MKTLNLLILTLSSISLINCASGDKSSQRAIATDGSSKICSSSSDIKDCKWNSCYNESENRVYFIPLDTITNCSSKTFFKGPTNYLMTDSGITDDGFTTGRAGVPVQQKREDGSRVFVSSWNNLESYNHIIVVEPDFANKTTKTLCQLKNYSESFSTRQNSETKEIEVLIREPKTESARHDKSFHYVWKSCK